MSPLTSPVGYVNNDPAIETYFANANLVADYKIATCALWLDAAKAEANIGHTPMPPPPPPMAVEAYLDAKGNIAFRTTATPVCDPPPVVLMKPQVPAGTTQLKVGGTFVYNAGLGRVYVPNTDTEPVNAEVVVSGVHPIPDGIWVKRGHAASIFGATSGPEFYTLKS